MAKGKVKNQNQKHSQGPNEIQKQSQSSQKIKEKTKTYKDHSYLIRIALLPLTLIFIYQAHLIVDEQIEGKWREIFPLNLLQNHPHIDTFKNIEEICQEEGYEAESHWITTEDGYINKVYRLNELQAKNVSQKPVVLLIHGLIDSSDSWLVNGRENSIGFILADAGYDVWMANTRGNKYSERHTTLDPNKDSLYWENALTYDVANYDIPSFIEYIKNISGVKNMTVIGHSQGSQQMFYNFIKNNTYFKKNVNLLVALGPVFKITDTAWINQGVINYFKLIKPLVKQFQLFRAFPIYISRPSFMYVCGYVSPWCDLLALQMAHSNAEFNDPERQKVFYGHYPAQSSIYQWYVIDQLINTGKFLDKDYGEEQNIQIYKQKSPPEIDLSKVNQAGIPIAMYVGQHDIMVKTDDSRWIRDKISSSLVEYVEIDGGHTTFMIGKNMTFVKSNILNLLQQFNRI